MKNSYQNGCETYLAVNTQHKGKNKMSYMRKEDPVIDYTEDARSSLYFGDLEVLQGKGKYLRGLKEISDDNSIKSDETFAFLYDAILSKRCEHERDGAYACVYLDEVLEISKEQYETFLNEGLFTESLLVV